jgi:hypothetical protein
VSGCGRLGGLGCEGGSAQNKGVLLQEAGCNPLGSVKVRGRPTCKGCGCCCGHDCSLNNRILVGINNYTLLIRRMGKGPFVYCLPQHRGTWEHKEAELRKRVCIVQLDNFNLDPEHWSQYKSDLSHLGYNVHMPTDIIASEGSALPVII